MAIIKALLAGVLGLGGVAVLLFMFFLDQGAVFLLQGLGVEGAQVQGLVIGPTRLHVASLAGDLALPGSAEIQIRIVDASFTYDLRQLLGGGKGGRMEIEGLDIGLKGGKKGLKSPLGLPPPIVLLEESLRARIPFTEITVRHLLVHGDQVPMVLQKDISFSGGRSGTDLELTARLKIDAQETVVVHLLSPDARYATGSVEFIRDSRTQVRARLGLAPDGLSLHSTLSLATLKALLGEVVGLAGISGDLDVFLRIPFLGDPDGLLVMTLRLGDLRAPGMGASSLLLELQGRPIRDGLILSQKSFLQGQDLVFQGTETPEMTLGLAEPLTLSRQGGVWDVPNLMLVTGPLKIRQGGRVLETGPLHLRLSELAKTKSGPDLMMVIGPAALVLGNGKRQLSLKDLAGTLMLKERRIMASLQFALPPVGGSFRADMDYDMGPATGSFSLATEGPLLFDQAGRLSDLLRPWSVPFDLEKGALRVSLEGAWGGDGPLHLRGVADLRGGDGYCGQFLFKGLEFHQDLELLPILRSREVGPLSMQQLLGGVDLSQVRAMLDLRPSHYGSLPGLFITDFSAALLGGSISASPIAYDLNRKESAFTVQLESLGLARLVDLIEMESLKVTGSLSGALPIRIKGRDLTILAGVLRSDGQGGEIRYRPGSVGQSGLTGYALKAVENLQYQTLKVTVGYLPSGQLDLAIGVKGTSPELRSNRPVHLNIQAEQNFPSLLQSLRFSKGLTEELDKRIKRHYN